jgi:hypothetical protein
VLWVPASASHASVGVSALLTLIVIHWQITTENTNHATASTGFSFQLVFTHTLVAWLKTKSRFRRTKHSAKTRAYQNMRLNLASLVGADWTLRIKIVKPNKDANGM